LPATYTLTRHGSYEISIAVICAIAVFGTWLALRYKSRGCESIGWRSLASAFAVGAIFSEMLSFVYYYFDYGHTDAKLSVGVAVSIIDAGVIAIVGAATVTGTFFAIQRITNASSATR